jgi:hypothetical protein
MKPASFVDWQVFMLLFVMLRRAAGAMYIGSSIDIGNRLVDHLVIKNTNGHLKNALPPLLSFLGKKKKKRAGHPFGGLNNFSLPSPHYNIDNFTFPHALIYLSLISPPGRRDCLR